MPILYEKPITVTPEALDGKSFARPADYGYARGAHIVPINAPQIVDAAAAFPVLFTAADPVMTVAVMGLRGGENLFVEADGQWATGHPVPDYIRRYPFILRQGSDMRGYILCIDSASAMIVDGDGEPFFEDGRKNKLLDEITESCLAYQRQSEITHALAAAIANSGILAAHDDVYTLPGGRKIKLDGFRAVDKAKLDQLPDETFLEWRRNGYLDFVYLHLVSLRTWPRLFRRMALRQAAEAAET
ncbi:MAG: SapC family protein [Alphaproteobacteria bacterium]|nr:SapC family protein [Alphaproteobacteria bacterium]